MFLWRFPPAVCVLTVCLALDYRDDIDVNYGDIYYNEITENEKAEPTPSSAPCSSPDPSKWDKMFSMLENSQMRENMLLQYADDIVKVEMGSLRSEMLRFVAQYGGSCGAAVETAGRRIAVQLEGRLRETLDCLKLRDLTSAAGNSAGNSNHLEAMLQQLLSASRTHASRLAKLESSCLRSAGVGMGMNAKTGAVEQHDQQEKSREAAMDELLVALQGVRADLNEVIKSSRQRHLPAGCEMALFFPARSPHMHTVVMPEAPLSLSSFTICMWVKSTAVFNKTVLFSYGNRRNPYEIQLLLSQTSALFTVGGEAHLVEAQGAVQPGEWIHLCGTWSSEQGLATLWADGKRAASTPGVAEGHVLPDGGSLWLGQENSFSYNEVHNLKLAFAGKMTGVNVWDRVLLEEEISQLALREGKGCQQHGSKVAWGLTEMVPEGGAQFIF
ncbi:pentraxin-related protein PTX3 [Cololabis saira]|uniref:pentraxin-related protein PTX3 n=1 Tax=Cololabis saira TaxID=129043 RepID=UPI002AD2E63D|nr:pentraxin-related protein PTX3 [Cololabis saira]